MGHQKRIGAIPLTSNMKTINTIYLNYTANSLILYKESKHKNLAISFGTSSLRHQVLFRNITFFTNSKKDFEAIKKDNKKQILFFHKLRKYSNLKEEEIVRIFPNKVTDTHFTNETNNFIICYKSLEQLASIFYFKKLGDNTQKTDFATILKNESNLYLNKPGIYMIQNKITKKKYIGKATNLLNRLENYCDYHYIKNNAQSSTIYRKILKIGHEHFSFTILEHCKPEDVNQREQFYINKITP